MNNCRLSYYFFDKFELYELPDIEVTKENYLPCGGGEITLKATGAEAYYWLSAAGDTLSTEESYITDKTGNYTLITRQCLAVDTFQVKVAIDPACEAPEIPNIITPEPNSLNDFFVIKNLPEQSHLFIYNRWGNLLFESANYQQNWNCNHCSDGTYFYVLITPDGNQYKGTLTVVGGK
jgi:gliding motility-associated-like protein